MNHDSIYHVENLPVQQNRCYSTAKEAVVCPTGNLILKQHPLTGIVSNVAFNPDLMVYDKDYQNEQGYSGIFQQHLHQVIDILRPYLKDKSILEVGCGKGMFLNLVRKEGFSAVGIDPAYEGNASYIMKKPFSLSLGVTGEVVILRHVLEHIHNPLKFLSSILEANRGKGIIYIEVPCLDWINEHQAWFDIFYEHVNYFRLSDFSRIFGTILESGKLFGGQYLYVIADMSTLNMKPTKEFQEFRLQDNFHNSIDMAIARIIKGRKNVLWGAASKGVIFALYLLQRENVSMDIAIDINPAKQGKYLPVTGLPVVSPMQGLSGLRPGDAIFVMNSNYFSEIYSLAGGDYVYYKVDQYEF